MAKITKERAEKALNDLTALVRDMVAEGDVVADRGLGEVLEHFGKLKCAMQWAVECQLNKGRSGVPEIVEPTKPYVRLELAKSLPDLVRGRTAPGMRMLKATADMQAFIVGEQGK